MELLNRLILLNKKSPSDLHATTIGNFDGCHLGHQRLFSQTLTLAAQKGLQSLAISFSPNPRAFFAKGGTDAPLFTNAQKIRVFRELGLDAAYLQHFDQAFSGLTAEVFYRDWLIKKFHTRALVVGHDFHFGAQRRGSPAFLQAHAPHDGITLHVEPPLSWAGTLLSTTAIKARLREEGDVEGVQPWLGRPYMVEGTVERGAQLGRRLGFPTANLGEVGQLLPKNGIYACRAWIIEEGESLPILSVPPETLAAVVSIGTRPTVDNSGTIKAEAHLLEGAIGTDALYGKRLGLYFYHRLRDEARFADLEELKRAIADDCARARRLLAHSA